MQGEAEIEEAVHRQEDYQRVLSQVDRDLLVIFDVCRNSPVLSDSNVIKHFLSSRGAYSEAKAHA